MEIKGIVNKPRYNEEVFKVGIPVYVQGSYKNYDEYSNMSHVGIIQETSPLTIKVTYVDKEGLVGRILIPVDDIVAGKVKVTILEIPEQAKTLY